MSNSDFPYDSRPDYALWRRHVQAVPQGELDPFAPAKFTIDKTTRVASAGSCFARNIAVNLRKHDFNYLCTEPESDYSANFGNVYTTVQLLQLFERAYGKFAPVDATWRRGETFVDALRPRVFERGFSTIDAVEEERERHLQAVRMMFEELDVFVFTLGLTEGFFSTLDGTAYPACPGKDFGEFDSEQYAFRNLTVEENLDAMHRFIAGFRVVNPNARILLTLSPVPLVATMEDRSIIQSTVYSKSVLRIVADELRRAYDFVDYFWSYEIITATYNASRYFEPDRRTVSDQGVDHVMRSFFRHFAGLEIAQTAASSADPCDEDVLHAIIKAASRG